MTRFRLTEFVVDLADLEEAFKLVLKDLLEQDNFTDVAKLAALAIVIQDLQKFESIVSNEIVEQLNFRWVETSVRSALSKPWKSRTLKCSFPFCPEVQDGFGFCRGHLKQLRQNKKLVPLGQVLQKKQDCGFHDCPEPYYSRGYCEGHYKQLKLGKKLSPLRIRRRKNRLCTEEDCWKVHRAKGKCKSHYDQLINNRKLRKARKALPI